MGANVHLHDLATLKLGKERLVPIQQTVGGPQGCLNAVEKRDILVLLNINDIKNVYVTTLKLNMPSVL
jgi:hypothetical protein